MDMSEKANVTFGGPVTVKMPIYINTKEIKTPELLYFFTSHSKINILSHC